MKILFIPTLGKGLGHIKRALLIASQLYSIDNKIDISIVIDDKILPFIDVPKFHTIVLPFRCNDIFQEIANSNSFISNTQYQKLVSSFIDNIKPDVVVYDFVISETIFQLVEDYGGKNVLILREQREKYFDYLITSGLLDHFNKILIPHDFEHFNLSNYIYNDKTVNVGPIFDRNINYARDNIRLKFNVSEKDIWIITSCGGGGFYNELEQILEIIKCTDDHFNNKKHLRFSYFEGVYSSNSMTTLNSQSLTIHNFDINLPSYFYSADIIVSYLGYNSFYEILNSGNPAILIPAKRTLDDQNKRVKGKKLPENIRICTNHNEAHKQLIELIEHYDDKNKLKSGLMLLEKDGAHIAANELISIPIIKNISIPTDSALFSVNEVTNLKDSFVKHFKKGITKFYFRHSDLSTDMLQNISNFYNEINELGLSYEFHLLFR